MKILMPYFKRYRLDVWIAMLSVIVLVFATLWQPRLLQVIKQSLKMIKRPFSAKD